MKTKLLFLISILSLSITLSGQYNMLPASDLIHDYSGQIRNSVNKTKLTVEGTPYIYDNFQVGLIFPKNNDKVFKVKLNVNVYSNLFEIQYEDRVYEMPNYAFDSIVIDQSTFIPVSVFNNEAVTFFSMEILSKDNKGNYLVKEYVVHLLEGTMAKAYHQETKARYQPYPANYYIYESEERNLIPLRQIKELSKNPEYTVNIKGFIKENRIKKRDVQDLQMLFHFLYPMG